jgi:putative nucleotidyltransferase with HDIG domain
LPTFATLDRKTKAWVLCVVLLGVALVPWAWFVHPISINQVGTLLYLAIGTQIAALLPIRWTHGNQYIYDPLLVATGLFAPGGGVAVVAWLALFDGRVPGRDAPWWALAFTRANTAIDHVVPSLAVTLIPGGEWWTLPVRTVAYSAIGIALNYSVTARALSLIYRTPFVTTLYQNVGAVALSSTAILYFSGGILFLLIQSPVGMLMAPGLFGFLLAVRGNVADVQRQTELKDQTLELAAQALDARDKYTESHSIRVAELAGRLGEHLDLGDRECELLRTAGSLHDLGKIGVRDDILNKPGPLTDEEWEIMRRHPDIGADMLAQHSALAQVAPLVRHHHERWDGSGYPAGLKGDVIPFGARILSVADSFDTITGTRLYRRSLMTPVEGVEDISRRAGQWYDPNVVDALRSLHGLEPLDLMDRPAVPRRITALRVLRTNPGFAQLLTAMGISALGDPLTQVAALVSIYAATNRDPRAVAVAFIAQALGTIVMSNALGGVVDRFTRRRMIVTLDLIRAALLIATPFVIAFSVWLIVPLLFVLAAINAIVQPARQAAVPGVVASGQVGKANAMASATTNACGAVGFGVAGVLLVAAQELGARQPTNILFIADGATFAIAALLILGIPSMGGGVAAIRMTGSLRRAWSMAAVRPHLAVSGLAAFLLAISFPALLALAYKVSPAAGAQTYSALEVVVSVGVFAGAVAVGRSQAIGSMRTAGVGLLLTGLFSLVMTMKPSMLLFVAGALFIASIGNPIYTVANQTALVEAADPSNRGTVMASRFGVVQTAMIAGTAAGGFITQAFGAIAAYGVLAIGLILLGMFALAAGRRISNPLHGRAYEEATLLAAGVPTQAE